MAQLRGIFASKFSKPDDIYLAGHSLGGLVALSLAERFPQHYAGALPMCGMIGGSRAEIDYVANVRVLFDFFYPGALRGGLLDLPEGVTQQEVQARAIGAMTANLPGSLQGAGAIAQIMAAKGTPVPVITANQTLAAQTLIQSITTALVFHARGFEDLYDRTHQHSPFDNRNTVYSGLPSPLIDAVNAGVARYDATPDATNYLQHWYQPHGKLQIPVLTIDNRFDPVVPLFHESLYAGYVADAGASNLLAQRVAAQPYGHCSISVDEMVAGLQDLVRWAETGVRPAS